jgi:hypothetical protein
MHYKVNEYLALLELLPLHLQIKKETLLRTIRLHKTEKWKPRKNGMVGHLGIMEDLYESLATKAMPGFMIKKLDIDKTFKVVLIDHSQGNLNRSLTERTSLNWHTDGLKMIKGVKVVVPGPHLHFYNPFASNQKYSNLNFTF